MSPESGGSGLQSQDSRLKTLDGSQIRADFGPRGRIAKRAVSALCNALCASPQRADIAAKWQTTTALPDTAKSLLEKEAVMSFGKLASNATAKPDEVLFAVQTYFALVAKHVAASAVLKRMKPDEPGERPFSPELCTSVETGDLFRRAGVRNFPEDDCYGWHLSVLGKELLESLREITECAAVLMSETAPQSEGHELFGELYASLIPRQLRHSQGEYYTPEWLVDFVLDSVGYDGDASVRLIDPSCGSGAFLMRALSRTMATTSGPDLQSDTASVPPKQLGLPNIAGLDVNPLAVLAAKANFIITLCSMLPLHEGVDIPVHRFDLITGQSEDNEARGSSNSSSDPKPGGFDLVVGNPPWVLWDNLSPEYREATKPLWRDYGLFSLSGSKGRMGGGKKDLSMLFAYRSIDRLIKDGGKLAFLITQSVFKTRGAGEGFRRFFFDGPSGRVFIEVKAVHDLTSLNPFPGTSNRTAVLICQRSDSPTHYPVPYTVWRRRRDGQAELFGERTSPIDLAERTELVASPVDEASPASSWLTLPQGLMAPMRKMIGPSIYKAWEGVNCAGLSGCFIVRVIEALESGDLLIENVHDIGKIKVKKVSAVVEPDLVYPQLLGRDLKKWHARPSAHVILAQDPMTRCGIAEETMREKFPKTLEYLGQFEAQLRQRAAFRKYFNPKNHPFWSMFNVGTYTLERWRVGWRIMGSQLLAAVLPFEGQKPVLPQNTHAFVSCRSEDEAHYLCAMLNSSLVNFLVRSYSVTGGKSFAPPHIMEYVKLPEFDRTGESHIELARLSQHCHLAAAEPKLDQQSPGQRDLNVLVSKCLGLSDKQFEVIGEATSRP
ncbi:MAG: N-6 DNA methylase [Candidatus Coatesbacteria bacterium]|nr:N-6 DNA methylase [Candidatus Coatesbacteria bacterium]